MSSGGQNGWWPTAVPVILTIDRARSVLCLICQVKGTLMGTRSINKHSAFRIYNSSPAFSVGFIVYLPFFPDSLLSPDVYFLTDM